ncbi:hypothetical protein [Amycolatopsis sp. SID8362]|uniref:hypothetical protein n=1 Tax=Amycolatopsis sp. SID8362 TaxID=2690346 RepID=UPI00136FA1DF|nr:hypothetical protein [Amycolatopsis sp. SID8362]NBH05476.1 hypothetical protein [Amycolatopsis sp. SID8362]NED42176.1 hypothetical protein [Amycolatopsis sp. SID8362]
MSVVALGGASVLAAPTANAAPADCKSTTQNFAYTGSLQTFSVPAGVTQIDMTVAGAAGGAGDDQVPAAGGRGAVMTVDRVPVNAGAPLTLLVGGVGTSPRYLFRSS